MVTWFRKLKLEEPDYDQLSKNIRKGIILPMSPQNNSEQWNEREQDRKSAEKIIERHNSREVRI